MNLAIKKTAAKMIPFGRLGSRVSPVLTYHACYRTCPPEVAAVDNISPEWLHEQLAALKKVVRLVPVDELIDAKKLAGLGAITFDDAYRSVIDEALPVLESLDIPFTIFANTYALEGATFWRHKVVYIMKHGLTAECEAFLQGVQKVTGESFYQYLKHPLNNSAHVEREIDRFLAHKGIDAAIPQYVAAQASDFRAHRLIWYGNHTHHHYVLASLPLDSQRAEIEITRDWLKRIPGIQQSECVALPFGRTDQANENTLTAVREAGYRALLLNRGQVNLRAGVQAKGVTLLERFSVNESPIEWDVTRQYISTLRNGTAIQLGRVA